MPNFTKILELIVIYAISFWLGLLSLYLIPLTFFKYGREGFKVKKRSSPPTILNDKRWGTHHYLKLKEQGIKLHYVAKGSRRKPLLLCLHGFPESWFSWRHQLEEFSSQFWVVALDLRGYGDSDKPQSISDYSIETIVEDIKEFILGLGRTRCSLLAHDWGGIIAWRLVELHPLLFERHISLNSPESETLYRMMKSTWTQIFKSWYIFLFQVPLLPETLFALKDYVALESLFRGPKNNVHHFSNDVIEAYKYCAVQTGGLKYPINYYRCAMWGERRKELPKITVPTLIIWGTEDEALSKDIAKRMPKLCTDIQLKMVEGAGHFVHEEEPTYVNKLIWEFVTITD